jgi:cytosine/adenosine deaminase-related metal-dependent hydrolase
MHDPGPISISVRRTVIRGARCALGRGESRHTAIQISDGRVTGIGVERHLISAAKSGDGEIDLGGFLIMPGFINAHDHLQFALHPRLADPPYRSYVDWGEDIHAKFPDVFAKHRAVPKDVRLWWGGLRNLLCGVTTVCHHDPLWAELQKADFPVRVVRDYGWGHSVALGCDLRAARSATPSGSAFIVHACEGVDEQARQELFTLDGWELLDANTVLVHGLAVDEEGVKLIKARRASLILCPSSNEFLFGRMPDAAVFGAIDKVALGSDSPLTSKGDLLDEIRFAIQRCGISPEAVYRMVTDSPAAMLGLVNAEGSIKVSGVGDLVAVRDTGQDVADGLPSMSMTDVEFVMVGGRVHLASDAVFERLPFSEARELEPLWIDGTVRWLRAPVKELLRSAEAILGAGEVRLGGKPVRVPEYLEAQNAS